MRVRSASSPALDYEQGSYRDRQGRVYYDDAGRVRRVLSERALSEWHFVSSTSFLQQAMSAGRIVNTELVTTTPEEMAHLGDGWAGVLGHEAIPFLSYPYE